MISQPTLPNRSHRSLSIRAWIVASVIAGSLHGGDLRAGAAMSAEQQAEAEIFFENQVRPLLAEKCISCHGDKKQHAGLRLDSRRAILTGGDSGPSVVPMKPDESLLIEAVRRESFEMPPDEALDDDQVQILSRWIEMGAPWPGESADDGGPDHDEPDFASHWAFQPIRHPDVPEVSNSKWPRNEIDFFILDQLEQRGLTPSPRAAQAVLARRIKCVSPRLADT